MKNNPALRLAVVWLVVTLLILGALVAWQAADPTGYAQRQHAGESLEVTGAH